MTSKTFLSALSLPHKAYFGTLQSESALVVRNILKVLC